MATIYDEVFIKNVNIPYSKLNVDGSTTSYAKIADIRTHLECDNSDAGQVGTISMVGMIMFRAFSYTKNTFEEAMYCLRVKTGLTDDENMLICNKKTKNFNIVLAINDDKTCSLYVRANKNESVKIQVLEGKQNYISFYSNLEYDAPIDSIKNVVDTKILPQSLGDTDNASVSISDDEMQIVVNTPVGGSVVPTRDSSVSFGSSSKRWRGGYFSYILQFPYKINEFPSEAENGYSFFHATLKKIVTYYNGKWYCNGEEVS